MGNGFHVYLLRKDRLKWQVHVNLCVYDFNAQEHAQTAWKRPKRVILGYPVADELILFNQFGITDQIKGDNFISFR